MINTYSNYCIDCAASDNDEGAAPWRVVSRSIADPFGAYSFYYQCNRCYQTSPSAAYTLSGNFVYDSVKQKKPECECGSHAVGSQVHSSWCEMNTPNLN